MSIAEWRSRLSAELERSGKSMRSVSLASGNGPGYMHSILGEAKEPTVENLINLCEAIGVSPVYILHGINVEPEGAEILKAIQDNPNRRSAILALLAPREAT